MERYTMFIYNDDFCIKTMNYSFKMMISLFKMMNSIQTHRCFGAFVRGEEPLQVAPEGVGSSAEAGGRPAAEPRRAARGPAGAPARGARADDAAQPRRWRGGLAVCGAG